MKLRMCNCRHCRWARHHSAWERYKLRHAKKAARHKTKILLHQGRYDELPTMIWIPYNS